MIFILTKKLSQFTKPQAVTRNSNQFTRFGTLRRYVYCLLLILQMGFVSLFAQKQQLLQIIPTDTDSISLSRLSKYDKNYPNNQASEKALAQIIRDLVNKGYLAASVDSILQDSIGTKAWLYVGNTYQLNRLGQGNVPKEVLDKVGYKARFFEETTLQFDQIEQLQESLLIHYENNGYPFAAVGLQNVQLSEQGFAADLHVDKHKRVNIDSIQVEGNAQITKQYLYNYLGLEIGQPYDESLITKSSTRIAELAFLQERQKPIVQFVEGHATVFLFLKPKKASRFNLLIGLLPRQNTQQTGVEQRYQVTGEGVLNLQNALGY
ncbi:MAG: POTRA domain-containing protein, partial [Chitinophagales bacterium]